MSISQFWKLQSSGNDFIVVEGQTPSTQDIVSLCKRKTGIGADGVLVLSSSDRANIKMQIFNPDGKEAGMCGNGLLCTALWLHQQRGCTEALIESNHQIHQAYMQSSHVEVSMGKPSQIDLIDLPDIKDLVDGPQQAYLLNTGVDHCVLFLNDKLEECPVEKIAYQLRRTIGKPGWNYNFCMHKQSSIAIRTFENGVDRETLACGTGATAAACVARDAGWIGDNISMIPTSGVSLEIRWIDDEPFLKGTPQSIYEGSCIHNEPSISSR